ncbi:MEMBRANE-ASSOCIATED KINASE REGULATOR 3 [Hibiscus trionum]|uniref:MEMBRANE-ASSOCIATED KINASE REGULATOR 3 n=1 Tax=Hibiscus trionum TaxID=183268 RepID=A0A9W7MIE2_HIBTR|nr:MEMBRANE-ASSOCIATED KINASE REGULATOR 3 [Hibiscus trionum]
MAISQASFNNEEEEEYIDMEVSSSSSKFLCYSISSPPQSREFEFQMCAVDCNGEITSTSPADELFYKGKLLPLHLPPRLQMVQKLLQSPSNGDDHEIGSISGSVPLESSCRDYFFEWSTQMNGFTGNDSNKSWSKNLKQMKQSSITEKLKASREYLKSLFSKSGCSDESCAKAAENGSRTNNRYRRMAKKNPFRNIEADGHRRSFSGVIQRHSATNSSSPYSASFSFRCSTGFCDLQLLKRRNSANPEIECSIQGAIAHCKQSQKLGVCSLSACGDQERPELCII